MITYNQKKKFLEYAKKISRQNLPKWEQLPEVDLYMDQVLIYLESQLSNFVSKDTKFISKSMINNYVKQTIMPAPINKKYSKTHLSYLIMICILKQILPLPDVKKIIEQKLVNTQIDIAYNTFCNSYNRAVTAIIGLAKQAYRNSDFLELTDFNLFMTIGANSAKLIIEELLKENEESE